MWQARLAILNVLRSASALFVVFLFIGVLCPQGASAVPAFARKYQTSCQTCHVAFPALTPFGEAFRWNGYRFPAGTDPSVSKDQPVSLGADGYKKLWPKAVWPGEVGGVAPVAMVVTSSVAYDHAAKTVNFGGLGSEFEVFGAGTLGEHFSFWASVIFARDGASIATEMERLNLQIRPFEGPELQFKVGSFEPGLLLVSTHRSLMDQELFALTATVGDNTWAPEPFQQGFEAFGVVAHRVTYNAGFVEGSGSIADNSKDVYGRVAYKVGGLAADGVGQGEGLPANPKPWSEKSVTVSGFAYKGQGILDTPDATRDAFRAFGGDVGVNFLDLMARAGLVDRKNDAPLIADPTTTDLKTTSQFAELSWVAYPWLVPAARWESIKVGADKTDRVSLTVTALVRANIKTFVAADWQKPQGGKLENEEGLAGISFGF